MMMVEPKVICKFMQKNIQAFQFTDSFYQIATIETKKPNQKRKFECLKTIMTIWKAQVMKLRETIREFFEIILEMLLIENILYPF